MMTRAEMMEQYGFRMLIKRPQDEATPDFEKFCRTMRELFDDFDTLDDDGVDL